MDLATVNPTLFDCYERAKAFKPDDFGARWKEVGMDAVKNFTSETGLSLPEDYVDFITRYGEFSIFAKDFKTLSTRSTWPSGKSANVEVSLISEPDGMLKSWKSYQEDRGTYAARAPSSFFPLTFDSGYGHAMLDLSKEHFGAVRYLVIKAKTFGSNGYGMEDVGHIADDFAGLIGKIKTEAELNKELGAPRRATKQ